MEADIRAWFDAPDLEAQKAVARRLNADALDHVVFVPTGSLDKQAWRTPLHGVVPGPLAGVPERDEAVGRRGAVSATILTGTRSAK